MRPHWLVAAFFLGATCCRPAAKLEHPRPSPETLAAQLVDETVALYDSEQEAPFCSGVWMSDAVFLTADHCVASKHATPGDVLSYVVRRDVSEAGDIRTIRHAAVLAVDETHDLALLRALDPPPHTAARLSSKKLVAGLPVFTMGHPVKLWWSFSSGEIAAVRILADEDEDPVHYVQATAPVSPGCSGGGLFDDEGNLVGVTRAVWGRQFGAENTNLFVHRDSVAVFLQHEGITS